jgi:O-antigen ligase
MSVVVATTRAPRPVLCAAAIVAWTCGNIVAEPIAQAGAYLLLVVALVRGRRASLEADVRAVSLAALLLAAWQAVSPALALWAGAAHGWPRSGRYGQFFDTFTPALAAFAAADAPWVALAWITCVGWTLSTALGTYQHFVRWPFAQPSWFRTPIGRVQEPFGPGGSAPYAAGGFLFHRLRFAHDAVATLGPALAVATRTRSRRIAAAAAATCAVLIAAIYLSYARAALLVAIAMTLAALAAVPRRRAIALATAAVLGALVLASPEWRVRFVRGEQNLFGEGERRLSMQVAWDLVRAHPLVGVGFGNYEQAAWSTRQATGVTPLLAIDAHNLWLTAWAETGLVGLALTIAYHALLARGLWRRVRLGSWAAAGGLLSFAGFHLLSLVHYLQHHTGVYLSFALAFGLGLAPVERTGSARLALSATPRDAPGAAP